LVRRVFAARNRSSCATPRDLEGILSNQQFTPAQSLITLPKQIPGHRQYRFAPAELAKNAACRALNSGALRRLARAGYIEINHLALIGFVSTTFDFDHTKGVYDHRQSSSW